MSVISGEAVNAINGNEARERTYVPAAAPNGSAAGAALPDLAPWLDPSTVLSAYPQLLLGIVPIWREE